MNRRTSMLKSLHIQNFAIIEDVFVSFNEGMTVLTGETGAGKSIMIDAMSLIVGGRGSADYVRYGASKCRLEAEFYLDQYPSSLRSLLEEESIDTEYNDLIIQREIYSTGRSVCRINGSIVTISLLKTIGQFLIDIHGQSEHQTLMNPDTHLDLLDQFGGDRLINLRQKYQEMYQHYRSLVRERENLLADEQALLQKIDYLKHQRKEIESAHLTIGELDTLEEEKNYLVNYQTISQALEAVHYHTNQSDQSAILLIGKAVDELEKIAQITAPYNDWLERLNDIFYLLQDLDSEVSDHLAQLEYDENRLDEVMSRIDQLTLLKRKYGMTIEELIGYGQEITKEIEAIENRDVRRKHLDEDISSTKDELLAIGNKLTNERRKVAEKLEKQVGRELKDLYMDGAEFIVHFEEQDIGADGLNRIQFYLITNSGEPAKPLGRIASGGELSRIMLALKTIFIQVSRVGSVIFDEIDTGVSGRVAQAIADKMKTVSDHSQVLAVTHLPQVAATADHHLYIHKSSSEGRVQTQAIHLNSKERIKEVARMLSGNDITDASVQAALALLNQQKK